MADNAQNRPGVNSGASVTLDPRTERHLIRETGSYRHITFTLKASAQPIRPSVERMSLRLGLVIDRSGSMSGGKLETAKTAALSALDRLNERDRVAIVVFDEAIEVVQRLAPVTDSLKVAARLALARIEPRGSTALHEGWLTGCQAIAAETNLIADESLARCFLLTDGLANEGMSDPELIARQAAEVREEARVSTSTFGIGADYNEGLLGPMAVAGGGQFHHLRATKDIVDTFLGEIGELLAVTASNVRLEIEPGEATTAEVISAYWSSDSPSAPTSQGRPGLQSIAIGDLIGEEERQIVVRFGFPASGGRTASRVRARVTWRTEGEDRASDWREIVFSYASGFECDAERRDPSAMHWIGLHHAERAKNQAAALSSRGDARGARDLLRRVAKRIGAYAGSDDALLEAMSELSHLDGEILNQRLSPMAAKEVSFDSQRVSRSQRDFRSQH